MAGHWSSWALGTTVGLLNGLIALGGGILVTPYLVAYRGLAPPVAVGTSLVVVVLLSMIGFAAHAAQGNLTIAVSQTLICALGGIFGTVAGSKILAALTPQWADEGVCPIPDPGFSAPYRPGARIGSIRCGPLRPAVPGMALFAIGSATGVLSAVFGVGGGALALLALVTVYGVPLKEGLPVALALNVSNALAGVVYHARNRSIVWPELRSLIPTAVVGVVIGAWMAQLAPSEVLRTIFGFILAALAIRLLRHA